MKNRSDIKVLILTGDGINCEVETADAFNMFGVTTEIVPIFDLIENPKKLDEAHILALPGGFSFGDEIGSGQILALKLKYSLGIELKKFIADKKIIIGICNGFQALVRLGFLPDPLSKRVMSLTHNRQGHFINKWAKLKLENSNCVWTQFTAKDEFMLPIRHGEGKIVFEGNDSQKIMHYENLLSNKQIVLKYINDENGSFEKIAGMTDPTGRVFGLMPHPEAYTTEWLNPSGKHKNDSIAIGAKFFESGINYIEKNFNFNRENL